MAIPTAVDAILRKNQINYGIVDLPPTIGHDDSPTVRCTILKHAEQRLQVLYPSQSLLDLYAVRNVTRQDWTALSPAALSKLCAPLKLRQAPALPGIMAMPVAVDESLLHAPELLLDTGDERFLRISGSGFRRLLNGMVSGPFSVALRDLDSGACDHAGDVAEISQAVTRFTPRRIRQRLEETLELPPLPETAQRIIQLRVKPHADIKDLSDIVESDPSLAAQVISWAASPYYAAPGKIRSVHDAIVRVLGFDLVLNLALGIALGRTLNLPREHLDGVTPYWRQAVFCAAAVEGLVGALPPAHRPAIGMAYLSGLLHNFGYLLLGEIFPPQFSKFCQLSAANPHLHHSYVERHLLGVTREQLAGWLMRLWHLPEPICVALRYQGNADYEGPEYAYPLLVFIAMRLLRQHGVGDASLEPIPVSAYQRLQLDPAAAQQAILRVMDARDELGRIAAKLE